MYWLVWILQFLLALHTAMGAVWKLTNPAQTVPALQAIPHVVWQALTPIELLCSVGLILAAFSKRLAILAPISAACIATEMLLFCGVYMAAGHADLGQLIYWLAVAAICAFFAYGRLVLKPL